MLLIPSAVLEAASRIPATGLITNPEIPCQVPFSNPLNPSFFAPSNGLRKMLKK